MQTQSRLRAAQGDKTVASPAKELVLIRATESSWSRLPTSLKGVTSELLLRLKDQTLTQRLTPCRYSPWFQALITYQAMTEIEEFSCRSDTLLI